MKVTGLQSCLINFALATESWQKRLKYDVFSNNEVMSKSASACECENLPKKKKRKSNLESRIGRNVSSKILSYQLPCFAAIEFL